MVADVKNGYRLLLFCLIAVLLCSLCACAPSDTDVFDSTDRVPTSDTESANGSEGAPSEVTTEEAPTPPADLEELNLVRMHVTYTDGNAKACAGDIVIRLCPDIAPLTVQNFKQLVSEGFYNGLTFHRVISGFMIQGGDPKGNGTGATGPIRGEFAANGIQNDLSHTKGVISMARLGSDYDSGSCQFFIVHEVNEKRTESLDGLYAAFGYVIEGIEHVDGIASTEVKSSNKRPIHTVTIVSATLEAELQ